VGGRGKKKEGRVARGKGCQRIGAKGCGRRVVGRETSGGRGERATNGGNSQSRRKNHKYTTEQGGLKKRRFHRGGEISDQTRALQ